MGAAHRDTVMVIGDTITFTLTINETALESVDYVAPSNITFTVKENKNDEEPTIQVSLEDGNITLIEDTTYKYVINVPSSMTSDLKENNYYYGLTLYFEGDVKKTVMLGVIKFIKGIS